MTRMRGSWFAAALVPAVFASVVYLQASAQTAPERQPIITEALVDAGGSVALADLNLEAAEAAARTIDPTGRCTFAVRCDVGSDSSVEAAAAATVARFGRLDGVVNNAGVIDMNESRHATSTEWQRQLDVNVTGVFRMCRAALDCLTASDQAAIVNLSSASSSGHCTVRAA